MADADRHRAIVARHSSECMEMCDTCRAVIVGLPRPVPRPPSAVETPRVVAGFTTLQLQHGLQNHTSSDTSNILFCTSNFRMFLNTKPCVKSKNLGNNLFSWDLLAEMLILFVLPTIRTKSNLSNDFIQPNMICSSCIISNTFAIKRSYLNW